MSFCRSPQTHYRSKAHLELWQVRLSHQLPLENTHATQGGAGLGASRSQTGTATRDTGVTHWSQQVQSLPRGWEKMWMPRTQCQISLFAALYTLWIIPGAVLQVLHANDLMLKRRQHQGQEIQASSNTPKNCSQNALPTLSLCILTWPHNQQTAHLILRDNSTCRTLCSPNLPLWWSCLVTLHWCGWGWQPHGVEFVKTAHWSTQVTSLITVQMVTVHTWCSIFLFLTTSWSHLSRTGWEESITKQSHNHNPIRQVLKYARRMVYKTETASPLTQRLLHSLWWQKT
jgi:hypothetical protein